MSGTAREHAEAAARYKAEGRFAEAQASWRAALALEPGLAYAHVNLGNLLRQSGELDGAVQCYRTALVQAPAYALAHANLGIALQDQAQYAQAQQCYEAVLALQPGQANILCNLAATLHAQSKLTQAAACYRQALRINPVIGSAHVRLVQVLAALQEPAPLLAAADQALALLPDEASLHAARGYALLKLGRPHDALSALCQALHGAPNVAEVHFNLGTALVALQRPVEACGSFAACLQLAPGHAAALVNLGALQRELRHPDAGSTLRQAVAAAPELAAAWSNLGLFHAEHFALLEAEGCLRRALELDPASGLIWGNLGNVLADLGSLDQAAACRDRACQLQPENLPQASNRLFGMACLPSCDSSSYLAAARAFGQGLCQLPLYTRWRCEPDPKRLRVGIVSADLWRHPVAFFLESVVAAIDSARFELIAYSSGTRSDDLSARMRPYFSEWKSVAALDDDAAAAMIEADGIHVLLDLAGHTAGNRLGIFARRPAPVQASWLGYFASTGLPQIDFVLSDQASAGVPDASQFSESLMILPDSRFCFTPPDDAPPVAPLPMAARGYVTFACFQNLGKVTEQALIAWGRIFALLPQARLRMQCRQLSDAGVASLLQERLAAVGITPDRVQLQGHMPRSAYLAEHADADIILDTFPYPGGTTTCEALWMGVPTVTLRGADMLGRQGVSLLGAAGLQDWIAADIDEYIEIAIEAAAHPHVLADLRAGLREKMVASPLCDALRFARNLESALWTMYSRKTGFDPLARSAGRLA